MESFVNPRPPMWLASDSSFPNAGLVRSYFFLTESPGSRIWDQGRRWSFFFRTGFESTFFPSTLSEVDGSASAPGFPPAGVGMTRFPDAPVFTMQGLLNDIVSPGGRGSRF